MSAPAGWRRGSFRGLPFVTFDHQQQGGRRVDVHELPQVELPVVEDLGKRGGRFSINGEIRGNGPDDFIAHANAFAEALNAKGPGTLVHPWLGSMRVSVENFTRFDSTIEGGFSRFSIDFVETGLPMAATATSDTESKAKGAAEKAKNEAPRNFDDSFSVAGATAFVEQAAEELATAAALATSLQAGLMAGPGPALRAFDGALGAFGVVGGVRDALALGMAAVGLMSTLTAIAGTTGQRVTTFRTLASWGADVPPVIGATPARTLQRDNQAALIQLVNVAAAAELVIAIADSSFDVYQDAAALRDGVAEQLDALALRQADLGDNEGAALYRDLRVAMVQDVTARGGSLARLQRWTPPATMPAIVIAQRLYGDPRTIQARADEIVARNAIAHPGFVPGGRELLISPPEVTHG